MDRLGAVESRVRMTSAATAAGNARRREGWKCFGLCTLIVVVSYCSMVALNFLAMGDDRSVQRARIMAAYESGELVEDLAASLGDRRRGVNQFNDCLILQSVLLSHGTRVRDSVSALVVAGALPCQALHTIARGALPAEGTLYDYGRYLFGARTVASIALQYVSLRALRAIGEVLVYSVLVCAVLRGVVLSTRRRSGQADGDGAVGLAAAIVASSLLLLSALDVFAPDPGHVYSDILIAGFVLWVVVVGAPARRRLFPFVAAAFGAWTAYFELLTGPLPMGAVIVGLIASAETDSERWPAPRWAMLNVAAFVLACCAVLLLQQCLVAAISGGDAFRQFAVHLALRLQLHHLFAIEIPPLWQIPTNLAVYGPADIARSVREASPLLVYGSRPAADAMTLAGLGLASVGLLASRGTGSFRNVATVAVVLLAVPAWFLAFGNHTVIHSLYMIRLMSVWWAGTLVMFGLAIQRRIDAGRGA